MKIFAAVVLNVFLTIPAFALTATNLSCFEGIEDPTVKYVVTNRTFEPDTFKNITDVGNGTVRMFLRFRPNEWWDGDQGKNDRGRQRAEVKGIGPHQKTGETFEYGTTWRTDPDFQTTGRFCHVFQLKATDGDNGAPLVTLSLLDDTNAAVRYWPGNRRGFTMVREFAWKPALWQTIKIRIKTSPQDDGEVLVSVNGDAFQGVKGVAVYRPDATDYRPKWGLYRGISRTAPMHDDYVEHQNASAQKLTP
jgi:Polysaccharide lyase